VIQAIDYAAIAPPLIVAVAAVAVLIADAFGLPRRLIGVVSGASLVAGLASVFALAAQPVGGAARRTFCVPPDLRGPATGSSAGAPAGAATGPSGAPCSYVADEFTLLFQALVLGAALVVLLLSLGEIAGEADDARPLPAGEFHFLLLAAITGALTMTASRDLIMLAVSLETLSLPVFALVALRRYDGRASEAALKLFLVSVVSAAVTLFGISLVYGVTGTVFLDRLAVALARTPGDLRPVAGVAVVLVLAGFGFKVAAVPFHFWAPDVYQGSPLPVAAFLSVVSKAAGFAGLILVLVGFWPYAQVWGSVAGVLAALTMSLGNLVALRQRHAVRLLAWSSVAQSGYMLAPLAVGAVADAGTARLGEAVAATVAYVAMYAVMNIGAFAVVTAVGRRGAGNDLDDYRGLGRTNPLSAAALAFFLVCLAGLPPGLMGLFAKIVVFRATVAGASSWLAVVMAVNTVIGLYYYLAWVVRLYAPPAGAAARRPGQAVGLAIAVSAAGAVVLSIVPQMVLHITPLAVFALR
jgi:NADH-quinone oxidoreductase subunit N